MFDFISIGDSVIDTFIPLLEAEVNFDNKNDPKLVLPFGNKIPVGAANSMVAGNASNSAVGASRLGLKSSIYTNIGDDEDGERVIKKLKIEKIDIRFVKVNEKFSTNHNIVLDFKGERTILTHHQPWKYDLPELERTKWIYLTSMAPSYLESDISANLCRYLEFNGAKLLYNPGTFQIKSGIKKNPKLLSLTEILIVNMDEAKIILGYEEGKNIQVKKLLEGLLDLGPKMVVITDGKNGSYGIDGENYFYLEAFPATVVEVTGAGDAYTTGFLAGLFYGKDLMEAMRWGAANGASVVEYVGAQEGLLSYTKMHDRLKVNSKIRAKQI